MSAAKAFLNSLFPPDVVCPFCNEEKLLNDYGFCPDCMETLVLCPPELEAPEGLDGLSAGLIYHDAASSAVQRFKYGRQVWLANTLASFIQLPDHWQWDCYVPVPLHPFRQWLRTFNQSELIAQALQKRYPFPIRNDLLRRTRYTAPQASLNAAGRAGNLANAFFAGPGVSGQSILLIDDVTTTHNTLLACAQALRKMGASRVYAACVCIANLNIRT